MGMTPDDRRNRIEELERKQNILEMIWQDNCVHILRLLDRTASHVATCHRATDELREVNAELFKLLCQETKEDKPDGKSA